MRLLCRRLLACMISIGLIVNLLLSVGVVPANAGAARVNSVGIASGDAVAAMSALLADLRSAHCHSGGRASGSTESDADPCFDCRLTFKISLRVPALQLGAVKEVYIAAPFPPLVGRDARAFFVRPASRGPPLSV